MKEKQQREGKGERERVEKEESRQEGMEERRRWGEEEYRIYFICGWLIFALPNLPKLHASFSVI